MEYEKLRSAAETITMPDGMKGRIVRNCKAQLAKSRKENIMRSKRTIRKPAAAFAVLVIAMSLTVTAMAATGGVKGFFQDITNWQGAIVGTSYEQATGEIDMRVSVNGEELSVLAVLADPQIAPYRYAEKLGIAEYKIVDEKGEILEEGAAASVEIVEGCASLSIPLEDIDSGNYKLIVTAFAAEKKADQPMRISGNWECAFTK